MSAEQDRIYSYRVGSERHLVLPDRMSGTLEDIKPVHAGSDKVTGYELGLSGGVSIFLPPVACAEGQYQVGDKVTIEPMTYVFNGKVAVAPKAKDITVTRNEKKVAAFGISNDCITVK